MFGPQGLRLVEVTDVSLRVDWESVPRAEYYILMYHPKNDESAVQEVVFMFVFFLNNIANKGIIFLCLNPLFFQSTLSRFKFPTQKTLISLLDSSQVLPTLSRCTLSSKDYRVRRTGSKLPQVSTDCCGQVWKWTVRPWSVCFLANEHGTEWDSVLVKWNGVWSYLLLLNVPLVPGNCRCDLKRLLL